MEKREQLFSFIPIATFSFIVLTLFLLGSSPEATTKAPDKYTETCLKGVVYYETNLLTNVAALSPKYNTDGSIALCNA